jgi:cofilin
MAATGVKVSDEIINEFNDMKLKKVAAKYIIYKIDNGKIVTDKVGPPYCTFDEFAAELPPNDGRYAVYDCDFTTSDGRPGNKLVSITW